MVFYKPVALKNLAEICKALGVGRKRVRKWVEQGAPIALEGSGSRLRYSAELAALQEWRARQGR